MEASQIVKQIDTIKNTFSCRAPQGVRYRIDVLWTYDAQQGDKLYAQGETSKEYDCADEIDKFNDLLDELSRNDNVGRLTVNITNRAGRNKETYTVLLREAYAQFPSYGLIEKSPSKRAQEADEVAANVQTIQQPGQQAPNTFGGLGSILGLLGGDVDMGLGDVSDGGQQKEIKGLRALLDFRDQRKEEAFERTRLNEKNATLEAKLREAEDRANKLQTEIEQRDRKIKEDMEANAKQLEELKRKIEGLQSDNEDKDEQIRKLNPDNSIFGVSLSQLGGAIATKAIDGFVRSHAGMVGSLFGVGRDQFLGMLDETNYQRQAPNATAYEDEDDDTADIEVTEDEDTTAPLSGTAPQPTTAPKDNLPHLAQGVESFLRKADPEKQAKFTAVLQEIANHPEALDDLYNQAVTQ